MCNSNLFYLVPELNLFWVWKCMSVEMMSKIRQGGEVCDTLVAYFCRYPHMTSCFLSQENNCALVYLLCWLLWFSVLSLLLYLMAFLKNSFPSLTDPPSPPSRPICTIEDLDEDIHCSWTKSNEPMIPTIYTLHWQDYRCDSVYLLISWWNFCIFKQNLNKIWDNSND